MYLINQGHQLKVLHMRTSILTNNSVMMEIPIKILTNYNSKIFMVTNGVNGITSDVGIFQLNETWVTTLRRIKT